MWSNGAAFSTGWYHPVLKVSDITHHTVIPKVISQVLLECIHREASSYSNQIPKPPHLALLNPKTPCKENSDDHFSRDDSTLLNKSTQSTFFPDAAQLALTHQASGKQSTNIGL